MANNTYVNKVIYSGITLIDISDSTVSPSDIKDGKKAYDKSGSPIIGSLDIQLAVTDFSGTISLISGNDYKFIIS